MANRNSLGLVVAFCGGASLLACSDEPNTLGETGQSVTSSTLLPPLTVAPGAMHAYLFDYDFITGGSLQGAVADEAPGFRMGDVPNGTSTGYLGYGANFVAHGDGEAIVLSGAAHSFVAFSYEVGKFGTGDFTVVLDYAGTYTGPDANLVSNRDLLAHSNFFNIRMLGPNGRVMVEVDQDTNGTNYNTVQGGAINDGQWHRVAAVRRGKQLSLAIDGVVVASRQGPGVANILGVSSNGNGFNNFMLGSNTNNRAPTGTFDNLTVYDRALTSAELAGIAAPSAFQDFHAAPTAWTNVSGAWTWDGQHSLTVASGTEGAVTWLQGLSASDFAIETRLKLNDYSGCAGLLLRGMNFTATNNGGQQYYVTLTPGGVIVGKNDNGWTLLGQASAPVIPGNYNTLRVEAIGSTLDVYVDNVLTLSVLDGSYASGSIGLKSYYGGATYDYVHVMPDLARGKATTQATTDYGGVSSRAVDGNNDGAFADGSITHTSSTGGIPTASSTGQWWQVDLGQISSVDHLTVWSRAASDCPDCGNRLRNYEVDTSIDGSVWTSHGFFATVPQRLLVPIGGPVRYVRVNSAAQPSMPLSLAEVTAWGTACGPDQIATSGGSCAACPAGLVTTDGATCTSPRPLSKFGGADYVSRLVAVGTGQCMVAANTTTVHAQPCDRHNDGWFLNEVDDPSAVGAKAYLLRTGNRCLVVDVPGADGTATVHATSAGCTGDGNLWNIDWNGAGQMRLHNEQRDLCLANARTGTSLEARACTGESAELWNPDTLRPRTFTSPFKVKSSGLCLQVAADGSVQQSPCQAAAPSLQLTTLGDGSFLIQGDGGRYLTALSAARGAQLQAYGAAAGTTETRWTMVPLDGGGFSLVSLNSGYCASFPSTAAGVTPIQVPCTGTDDQHFDKTQLAGSVPMRIRLDQIGSDQGTALVITGDAGVHVTTDPKAIAVVFQASGLDLSDPLQRSQLLSLLNPQQGLQLQAALNGPDGLGGSVAMRWSPINPAAFSLSGTYNDGFSSGVFHLRPFSVGGTNTQNYGYGVSSTVDWSVNATDGNIGINAAELDSPIGRGTIHLSKMDLLTSGIGGSIEIGSFTLGLYVGINGVNYTGPFGQQINTYFLDYVNAGFAYDRQLIQRGVLDAFTASVSWGQGAYATASSSIAGFTSELTNAFASGYTDVASAVTTAVDAVENFFGNWRGWF